MAARRLKSVFGDLAQLVQAGAGAPAQQRTIGGVFHHLGRAGFRRVRPNALAIDVDHESVEAQLAKHLGALLRVFADPAPFRENQNARALAAVFRPDCEALARLAVMLVVDRSGFRHISLLGSEPVSGPFFIPTEAFWRRSIHLLAANLVAFYAARPRAGGDPALRVSLDSRFRGNERRSVKKPHFHGFQPCCHAAGGLASISTKAIRQTLPLLLTQAWLVPCWIKTSPGFRWTSVSSISMSISPSSTMA